MSSNVINVYWGSLVFKSWAGEPVALNKFLYYMYFPSYIQVQDKDNPRLLTSATCQFQILNLFCHSRVCESLS
jgi:hypothetical protein